MILLLGTDAYSPFRMDAIRDAIAKLDPGRGPVSLDAKWVYALETSGEAFDPEELSRAATLLNAVGPCDRADFFVTPRKGTISPVGRSGLIVSGVLSLTSPVTVMTLSRCAFSTRPKKLREGCTTICVRP